MKIDKPKIITHAVHTWYTRGFFSYAPSKEGGLSNLEELQ
jgi:hypothetical protein